MTGDPFKQVFAGQPLKIPSLAWNELMRLAQANRARVGDVGDGPFTGPEIPTVTVRNDSGGAVGQYGVLGINSVIIAPTQNAHLFQSVIGLAGITPSTASHMGKFVVLAEPLANGQIGKGWAEGVFPAKISITNVTHKFADIKAADASLLLSGTTGSARILWAESGTGSKMAIVRIEGDNNSTGSSSAPTLNTASSTGTISMTTTMSLVNLGTLTLTPGVWQLTGNVIFGRANPFGGGGVDLDAVGAAFTLTSGTALASQYNQLKPIADSVLGTPTNHNAILPTFLLDNRTVGGSTTVYVVGGAAHATATWNGYIAYSQLLRLTV